MRGRAKAQGGAGSYADAPDRHAEAFRGEVDDRRRAERQQLTQEEAADDRDPERAAEFHLVAPNLTRTVCARMNSTRT